MLFFLKRIFFFVIDNWKIVLPIIALLIGSIFIYRACHKTPHLDEQQIKRAQDAIAKQDREEMTKVLVDAEVKEKQIDANLANSDSAKLQAIYEARRKANAMTNEELARRLEELANE
jgi:hypothetical protein